VTGQQPSLGGAALLRVAGLPIRCWLAGANPDLFAQVRQLALGEDGHRARTGRLAERIGTELVPRPGLSRPDRAELLAVRRLLHRGDPVPAARYQRVLQIVAGLPDLDRGLPDELARSADRERELACLGTQLAAALTDEQSRLRRLPAEIRADSPVARAILPDHPPEPAGQDHPPADPGGRRHRRPVEYAWRQLTRAATSATPRAWYSHVALLPVAVTGPVPPAPVPPAPVPPGPVPPGPVPPGPVLVGPGFAARWAESVRACRRSLTSPPPGWPAPGTRLAVAPLHWHEPDGRLVVLVLDQHEAPEQVSVRRTPLLDAVVTALAAGPRTHRELARTLGCGPEAQPALREFLRQLVTLGVLQPAAPPRTRLVRPDRPDQPDQPGPAYAGVPGWVDVYRDAGTALAGGTCAELQAGVLQAVRVLALMAADDPAAGRPPARDSHRSWPVTDLLRAHLTGAEPPPPHRHAPAAWPAPAGPDSGWRRLVGYLADRLDATTEVDIGATTLDRLGAPTGPLDWPLDCLLRVPAPGTGYAAVLEQLWPPGTVDARFAEALAELHGRVPQVEAYRAFLDRLEELTGVLFVELLAPPLSDGAANAVRRPRYTRAWTGDPHAAAYLPAGAVPERYLPLGSIRVRRSGGRLRADVDGQPIWPVHHATRSFSPPWDHLGRLLLAAAPRTSRWAYRRPQDPLVLFPGRRAVPRITVDGGRIVLSPAQWRLAPGELWEPGAPLSRKVRALARLRDRRGLPRWGQLAGPGEEPAVHIDLESLHAVRALERWLRSGAPIRVVEMLPAPDQLLVTDLAHRPGDRLVSELLLRLPVDEAPAALADRLAPDILASLSLPAGPTARAPPGASCRGRPAAVHCRQPCPTEKETVS
jgi:hypothetical protein